MLDERVLGRLSGALAPRAWVEANLHRFGPAPAAAPRLEEVKPLGELGLILLAVDDRWARDVAASLAPRVADWEAAVDWRAVAARTAARPRAVSVALPGVAWELLTGRPSPVKAERDAAVAAAWGDDLEVAFVRDLAGAGSCEHLAVAAARQWRPAGWSWVYELTHAVFHATRMGRRAVAFGPRVRATLAALTEDAFARGDADLRAELLLALAWSGGHDRPELAAGLERLRALAAAGPVELDPRACAPDADPFARRYHPTLVTLAALAL